MSIYTLIVCYKSRPKLNDSIKALNSFGLKPYVLFQEWQDEYPDGDYYAFKSSTNLGCAGARNKLFEIIEKEVRDNDYLFFIDDDAVLRDFDKSILDKNYEIIAGKSYLSDLSIERPAIPRSFNLDVNKPGIVYRVTGVCFFIKKECFVGLNGFYNYFPYGYEESDLSLKAYRNNIKIYYEPNISVVHHKERQDWARVRMEEHQYQIVSNKMLYLNRNFDFFGRILGKIYWTVRFKIRGYEINKIARLYFLKPSGQKPKAISIIQVFKIFIKGRLIVL